MLKLIKRLNVFKTLILLSTYSVFNSLTDIFIFYGIGKILLADSSEISFLSLNFKDLNGLLLITVAVRLLSNTIFERIKSKSIWLLYKKIAVQFVNEKLELDFWYHKGVDKGVVLRKLTKDIPNVGFIFQSLINIVTDFFFSFTIIMFLILSQPIITLILIPAILVISLLIKKSLSSEIKSSSKKRLKSDELIKKWILTFKSSLEQVESIFASNVIANKINDQIELRYLAGKSQVFLTNLSRIFSENSILLIILLALYILPQEKNNEMIWILPLLVRIIPNISRINTSYSTLSFFKKEVEDILDEIKTKTESPVIFSGSIENNSTHFNVSLEKLKYINHDKPLLSDFNFLVPLKEVTFLLGNSGCGKSTLARVLVEATKSKKDNFIFLPQTPTIFPDTLKFNVCLDKNIDNKKILNVLESVNLFPESEGLTLDSLINDDNLSGGQMQRISIARSIYYDGQNIILDEPTNNLDKSAKIELKNVIQNLIKLNKTFLIISHDLDFISLFENPNLIKI